MGTDADRAALARVNKALGSPAGNSLGNLTGIQRESVPKTGENGEADNGL